MESVNRLSEELLHCIKVNAPTNELVEQLASFPKNQLLKQLNSDNLKKSFWINIYNSYFQLLRRQGLNRPKVYTSKQMILAGMAFSLDDIEHGILRKCRYKFPLGLFRSFFMPKRIKTLAVDTLDYRIHFALNCGAKNCPPIAFYASEQIEEQLERATKSFLESETIEKPEEQEIHISTLFKWYWADFGGKKGIQALLRSKLNIETEGKKLKFTPYSWEEDLNNYTSFERSTSD